MRGERSLFFRTAEVRYVDEMVEPVWMSREAAFFGACLQMPRDRYGPVAEQRLCQVARSLPPSDRAKLRCGNLSVADSVEARVLYLHGGIVEKALDLLETDHGGQVSRSAQRRRLVELGLAVDATQITGGACGRSSTPRFAQVVVSDRVLREALG